MAAVLVDNLRAACYNTENGAPDDGTPLTLEERAMVCAG